MVKNCFKLFQALQCITFIYFFHYLLNFYFYVMFKINLILNTILFQILKSTKIGTFVCHFIVIRRNVVFKKLWNLMVFLNLYFYLWYSTFKKLFVYMAQIIENIWFQMFSLFDVQFNCLYNYYHFYVKLNVSNYSTFDCNTSSF